MDRRKSLHRRYRCLIFSALVMVAPSLALGVACGTDSIPGPRVNSINALAGDGRIDWDLDGTCATNEMELTFSGGILDISVAASTSGTFTGGWVFKSSVASKGNLTLGAGTADTGSTITFDELSADGVINYFGSSSGFFRFDKQVFIGTGAKAFGLNIVGGFIQYEGTTNDSNETHLGVTDPSQDTYADVPDAPSCPSGNHCEFAVTPNEVTHGVTYWGDSSDAFDTGDEVCQDVGLTCASTYSPLGINQICTFDHGTATTYFYALCY